MERLSKERLYVQSKPNTLSGTQWALLSKQVCGILHDKYNVSLLDFKPNCIFSEKIQL